MRISVPDLGSNGRTGQDKSLELPGAQFRWRTCWLLTIVGADPERLWTHSGDNRKSRPFQRLSPEFEGSEKPATSRVASVSCRSAAHSLLWCCGLSPADESVTVSRRTCSDVPQDRSASSRDGLLPAHERGQSLALKKSPPFRWSSSLPQWIALCDSE